MSPEKEICIDGCHCVREYVWAGERIVYLDQQLQVGKSFDLVCREVRELTGTSTEPAACPS
jgi:hypothetical protein